MKNIIHFFENVAKLAAGFSIMLLCFSYFDINNYYYHFNISITEYLSVSELVIISLAHLLEIFKLMAVPLLILFICVYDLPIQIEDKYSKSSSKFFKRAGIFALLNIAILVAFFSINSSWPSDSYWLNVKKFIFKTSLFSLVVLFISCFTYMDLSGFKFIKWKFNKQTATIFVLFFILFYISILTNGGRSSELKRHSAVNNVYFKMKDNTKLVMGDSLGYIGKTADYLFIYNRKLSVTEVFKTNEILHEVIPNSSDE